VGAPDWEATKRAAREVSETLAREPTLSPAVTDDALFDEGLRLYRPYRDRLLTPEQLAALEDADPAALGATATMRLLQPGGGALTEWREDPLGLWPAWWSARASESPARPREGHLWLS